MTDRPDVEDGLIVGSALQGLPAAFSADTLPPFLRVLLTTDGTVTKSLEAFFWETIEVVNREQKLIHLLNDEPLLGKLRGEQVLRRRVELVGRRSRTLYARADSMVVMDALPKPVRIGLELGRMGIGELLRDSGFETFRELVDFGGLDAGNADLAGVTVWRRYLIRMKGKPLILIKEEFPVENYPR